MSEETKSVLEGAVSDLDASQLALDDKLRDALTALDSAFKALDGVTDSYTAQAKRLRQVKDIAREMKSIPDEIEAKILNLETRLGKLSAARPKTGSLFLRFALGKVNARVWKRSEVIQLKSEYNKFKHRTTFVFILLPLLQIFFPTKLLASVSHLYMLYYYSTLSIRENILQVNGSNIKDWWIFHHYLSMVAAVLIILWPAGPIFFTVLKYIAYFEFSQGIVMILQNQYQDRRHYVRTSLGKAKETDLTNTETLVEKPVDLKVLVPILFVLYFMELGLSGLCLYSLQFAEKSSADFFMLVFCGILIGWIGIGNISTTAATLIQKSQKRKTHRKLSFKKDKKH